MPREDVLLSSVSVRRHISSRNRRISFEMVGSRGTWEAILPIPYYLLLTRHILGRPWRRCLAHLWRIVLARHHIASLNLAGVVPVCGIGAQKLFRPRQREPVLMQHAQHLLALLYQREASRKVIHGFLQNSFLFSHRCGRGLPLQLGKARLVFLHIKRVLSIKLSVICL